MKTTILNNSGFISTSGATITGVAGSGNQSIHPATLLGQVAGNITATTFTLSSPATIDDDATIRLYDANGVQQATVVVDGAVDNGQAVVFDASTGTITDGLYVYSTGDANNYTVDTFSGSIFLAAGHTLLTATTNIATVTH